MKTKLSLLIIALALAALPLSVSAAPPAHMGCRVELESSTTEDFCTHNVWIEFCMDGPNNGTFRTWDTWDCY